MKVGLNVMGPEQASQEEPYSFKKYRKAEYVQRRVCFVNVQVPWPSSIIDVKLCTSHL